MIDNIFAGDITGPENDSHIIIGMNSELKDVRGIGKPFVKNLGSAHPIDLGSVLSFKFDRTRNLHMIVCHHLGRGGWAEAEKYVRCGMDYLWRTEPRKEKFSMVRIGTGVVGTRDGADRIAILSEISESHLLVDLFIDTESADVARAPSSLVAFRNFHPIHGEERLMS